MTIAIQSTLTRCRHGQPLVVLDSEPFNGMEIRPVDLLRLAQQLTVLAGMASQLPTGGKHWHPTKVRMGDEVGKAETPLSYDQSACLAMLKLIEEMVACDSGKLHGAAQLKRILVDLLARIEAGSQLNERMAEKVRAFAAESELCFEIGEKNEI